MELFGLDAGARSLLLGLAKGDPHGAVGNPSPEHESYNATVGPHAAVTRWTYTCPADKIAVVDTIAICVARITVAAPVALYGAYIHTNIAALGDVTVAKIQGLNNTLGDGQHIVFSPKIRLEAGDVLEAHTVDLGTGGTVAYDVTAHITEFDV